MAAALAFCTPCAAFAAPCQDLLARQSAATAALVARDHYEHAFFIFQRAGLCMSGPIMTSADDNEVRIDSTFNRTDVVLYFVHSHPGTERAELSGPDDELLVGMRKALRSDVVAGLVTQSVDGGYYLTLFDDRDKLASRDVITPGAGGSVLARAR